ncbi:hypothetical protein ACFLZB_02980 [Nanoarchaeota archaeon]
MKKPDLAQIASIIMIVLVIANITLFALGRNPPWLFWTILIIAAVSAYWAIPKIRKNK